MLKLTAKTMNRNEKHCMVHVWQNGGLAGTLTVETEMESRIISLLNTEIK